VTIDPHIMKLVATERIADLRRDAAPRPEAKANRRKARRVKRPPQSRQAIQVAQAEDR
jgi:hypothetical protein